MNARSTPTRQISLNATINYNDESEKNNIYQFRHTKEEK